MSESTRHASFDRHDHGHGHGDERSLEARLRALASRRVLAGAVMVAVVATLVGLVVLWPGETESITTREGETFFGERVNANIDSVERGDCSFASVPGEFVCDQVTFTVTSGNPQGDTGTLELPVDAGGAILEAGDKVILNYSFDAPEGAQYQFADFQRSRPMLVLVALFAAAVIALGRWRGLFALIGVGISLVVLVAFVLPALLEGETPVLVALVGASAVAIPALYLAHGLSERTSVALLGTIASLLLTCLLGWVFVEATHLTGLVSDEVGFLQVFGGNLDFAGLLLAGLVIGALGVLDDVTVTQVAAVWELRNSDPAASAVRLYRAGIRIGRDHIASTVNTLVLAYAGASLPLLLLFRTSGQGLGSVITGEAVAAEVVRALVGSIGLVASVPITTGLAALVVTRDDHRPGRRRRTTAERPHRRTPEPPPQSPRWDDFGPDSADP
jgi:uncharacterized membrane protein